MNTDQYPNISYNQYFALKNQSEHGSYSNRDELTQFDHDLGKKHTPDYANYAPNHYNLMTENQPKYQPVKPNFDQNSNYNRVEAPNQLRKIPEQIPHPQQNQKVYSHPAQVIIYNSMEKPYIEMGKLKSSEKITVIVDGPNQKDSLIYGQSVPCQRCGLVANGSISLHKGRTVGAWATCLFVTTVIFFFLPCVMDRCKDTWIECARCGHKKAVVKSRCCC